MKINAYSRNNYNTTTGIVDLLRANLNQGVATTSDVLFNSLTLTTGLSILGNNPSLSPTIAQFVSNGGISINNSTNAVSSSSGGALTTLGGGAIGKKLYVGADTHINYQGLATIPTLNVSPSSNGGEASISFYQNLTETGALWKLGHNVNSSGSNTFGIFNSTYSGDVLTINSSGVINTTAVVNSTSSTVGAIITQGGVSINNSTNAISPTNGGALTVAGGAAFGGDVYVGGNLHVGGSTSVGITSPPITSFNLVNITGSVSAFNRTMITNGNNRQLFAAFRLTPTTSSISTTFQFNAPDMLTNYSNTYDVLTQIDAFYNDGSPISVENCIGSAVPGSISVKISFTSGSTTIHTIMVSIVYTAQ